MMNEKIDKLESKIFDLELSNDKLKQEKHQALLDQSAFVDGSSLPARDPVSLCCLRKFLICFVEFVLTRAFLFQNFDHQMSSPCLAIRNEQNEHLKRKIFTLDQM
jgi:hypothetical protein